VVIGLRGVARHLGEQNDHRAVAAFAPATVELSADRRGFSRAGEPLAPRAETMPASFVDLSDGGCRLRTRWEGIQTGDVIAVHWGQADWRIGSLTWINRDGDEWECGVQWLLDQPQAAMVSFGSGDPDVALLGRCHQGGDPALIFGSGGGAVHRRCRVSANAASEEYAMVSTKRTGLVELARIAEDPLSLAGLASVHAVRKPSPIRPVAATDGDGWGVFVALGAGVVASAGNAKIISYG